ncbi:S8 family serine peptidase [Paenibacillus arenilitoris]|uniref:S8 family serine peptidase n=1 Tax=Paenibacillus arenilitoris TaxID=2772299 RepID=A0A927H938_9BACL|nr:S8 family serine peptidase [Paenibacillus arenilitoris]MBD2871219.1 S8 family serine peptidase [Paenibacillus arenilitoris]
MHRTSFRKRWLTLSILLAFAVSLASPAAGSAAEAKRLHSSLDADQFTPPSAKIASTFDHSLKREALKQGAVSSNHSLLSKIIEPRNFVPASDSPEPVDVIVELKTDPVSVHRTKTKKGLMKSDDLHQSELSAEQTAFEASLAKLSAKPKRQYKQVFNGYSLTIPGNQVEGLLLLPGVKAVYPDLELKVSPIDSFTPNMDESAPFMGAGYLWDLGFDGTGIKVGVLDTGIDYRHPSLAPAYKGGYDFVDDDADPMETPPDPNDPEAATDHGTHVSGTIAGRGDPLNPDSGTGWVRGVAYGSDLYAYRVLGPGGTGSTEDVLAAIERSVLDDMDIINLSLGSSVNDQYDATAIALNNAMLDGVVAVTANGNDGPDDYTVGSPGTADIAISVGASSPPLNIPTIQADGIDKAYASMMAYSPELGDLQGQPLELVDAGLGTAADFEGKDLSGKAALIARGSISFTEKSLNAQAAGAAAAVIYNNEPGNFGGTLGSEGDYIPTMSLSQEVGLALKAQADANESYLVTFGIELEQDFIGEFSSIGPTLPGLTIKPDLSAPGVAIRSSVPAFDGNYENAYADLQGTSMASPHIAGAAALLLQKYGTMEPFEVKSLLMNNAFELADREGQRYSSMAQGAGRADLGPTIEAKAVAMVEQATSAVPGGESMPYLTGSISFGQKEAGAADKRTVTLKDIAGTASAYSIATVWHGEAAGTLTTSKTNVAVSAGGSALFDIALQVDPYAADGRYEGKVILAEGGGHTLHLPFVVYVGDVDIPDAISHVALEPPIFSPNGDGVTDTANIAFNVNLASPYFSLDVYDAVTAEWKGTILETADGIAPGSYIIEGWDGQVTNPSGSAPLEEGLYVILPWAGNDAASAAPLEAQASPFVIDVSPPVSALDKPAYTVQKGMATITGQIKSDYMIDLFGDYSAVGVAALYKNKGWVQADGVIAPDGSFSIQVPYKPGLKPVEVYVYDLAGNGTLEPAHTVKIKKGKPNKPKGELE